MSARVAFHGYVHDISGYGTAARAHIAALRGAGVEVDVNPPLATGRPSGTRILHAVPDQLDAMAEAAAWVDRTIVMSVWETTRLPRAWLEPLRRHADEIWTPSEHSAEAFREVGVPVFVMPHPVEVPAPVRVPRERVGFAFLSVGEWSERKNQRGLIDAFAEAFRGREEVILWLVSRGMPDDERRRIEAMDRVSINLFSHVSADHLAEVYNSADAYVSLHRAEGFGLCLAEAMAHGLPVVATDGSGPKEWADDYGVTRFEYVVATSKVCPDAYPFDSSMVWDEPIMDDAVDVMRALVKNGPRERDVHWAREHIRQHLSPARIGQMMRERLEAV